MSADRSEKTPAKWCEYGNTFKTEALSLVSESRSTQPAARQLHISLKLLYRWQEAKLVSAVGSVEEARDSELRQLRAQLKWTEQ